MTFQLRMYTVAAGALDQWLREWREQVLPLRRAAGFEVLGPWIVRAESLFVWILGHEDFAAADAADDGSPERGALEPDPARHLVEVRTWLMESPPPT